MASSAYKGHIVEVDPIEEELNDLHVKGMVLIDEYNRLLNILRNVPYDDTEGFDVEMKNLVRFQRNESANIISVWNRVHDRLEKLYMKILDMESDEERETALARYEPIHETYQILMRTLYRMSRGNSTIWDIINDRIIKKERKEERVRTQSQNQQMRQGRGPIAQLSSKYRDRDLNDSMRACLKCGAIEQ